MARLAFPFRRGRRGQLRPAAHNAAAGLAPRVSSILPAPRAYVGPGASMTQNIYDDPDFFRRTLNCHGQFRIGRCTGDSRRCALCYPT